MRVVVGVPFFGSSVLSASVVILSRVRLLVTTYRAATAGGGRAHSPTHPPLRTHESMKWVSPSILTVDPHTDPTLLRLYLWLQPVRGLVASLSPGCLQDGLSDLRP
jgi:hypothetical protein